MLDMLLVVFEIVITVADFLLHLAGLSVWLFRKIRSWFGYVAEPEEK